MPRGETTDRQAVSQYVKDYYAKHGERPTQLAVAEKFGVTQSTVGNILRTDTTLPGQNRTPGRKSSRSMVETDQFVYNFVREFTMRKGWAPSQREVAAAIGCAPHKANFHLHRLHQQNLIELGPHPRQVNIVGSRMDIPEITL